MKETVTNERSEKASVSESNRSGKDIKGNKKTDIRAKVIKWKHKFNGAQRLTYKWLYRSYKSYRAKA